VSKLQKIIQIESDTLISHEENFRVIAGPGAGKTFWLVNHIKNVLSNSTRLSNNSKIACITYTNNAVGEIVDRLRNTSDNVYISTIHNFLYKFVIKPYGFLLKNESDEHIINLYELDGHEEHIPNSRIINEWKKENNLFYIKDDNKIFECLSDLDWKSDNKGNITLQPRKSWKRKIGKYWIKNEYFQSYKSLYWKIGVLHHEDVLYFSYIILKENPEVLSFLSTLIPYIFVDEFQDTNPLQTNILSMISMSNTKIGVIGDPEQSIYGFQGANRKDFHSFNIPELNDYIIKGNRRSSNEIVHLLNNLRSDNNKQIPIRNTKSRNPRIIVGKPDKILYPYIDKYNSAMILSRNNQTIGQIKNRNNKNVQNKWELSRSIDSNADRQLFLYKSIYAAELTELGLYKESIQVASKIFYKDTNNEKILKTKKKELSILLIEEVLNIKRNNKDIHIFDFINNLQKIFNEKHSIKICPPITRGKYKDLSEKLKYSELVQALRISDDNSNITTIHKAKGLENEKVFVVMDNKDLKYLIDPEIDSDEDDSRIYYVALSRARDDLQILIPNKLDSSEVEKLISLGFDVII